MCVERRRVERKTLFVPLDGLVGRSVFLCRNKFDEQEELVLGEIRICRWDSDVCRCNSINDEEVGQQLEVVLEYTMCDIMSTAQGRSKQKGQKTTTGG